jgi:hypothetical protein
MIYQEAVYVPGRNRGYEAFFVRIDLKAGTGKSIMSSETAHGELIVFNKTK